MGVTVNMTCMTTKQKFDATDPEVVVLANGRYAYKAQCPWEGKNGKTLFAFKFCSAAAYSDYKGSLDKQDGSDPEQTEESEQ